MQVDKVRLVILMGFLSLIESFTFQGENDCESDIFPIYQVKCARARTNAILAGKCGSRRHSTTSFIVVVDVVVAKTDKTSCQMEEILSFSDRERA